MTIAELNILLQTLPGMEGKVAYRAFPKDEDPELPYIAYLITNSDNFYADNYVFATGDEIDIELYSKLKNKELERKIEELLNNNEIPWERDDTYIDDEEVYETIYTIYL